MLQNYDKLVSRKTVYVKKVVKMRGGEVVMG
jgi:hypothetical protein